MIGAAICAIVLGVLEDGFNFMGINAFAYQLVLGLAILGAMILNIQMDSLRTGHKGRSIRSAAGSADAPRRPEANEKPAKDSSLVR
jgi:simple sugar transport system permease protein